MVVGVGPDTACFGVRDLVHILLRRQLNIYRFALAWSGAVLIHFVVFARLRAQFINPARAHTATGIELPD
jgi:hypothetical protein